MQTTRARIRPGLALPLIAATLLGCATTGDRGRPLIPSQNQARTGPFVVFTSEPLASDAPVVRDLASLRSQVEEKLGLKVRPDAPPIEVYVLEDRKAFEHFLTFYYPDLPTRRAFFIAQGPRRVVYTFRGDRLEEDIRHEATHALLHNAAGEIPLWLDEGLAEYFEVEDPDGLNREHVSRLNQDLADHWRPDLPRLEALGSVRQMSPRDYREAWAWVHYLLNDTPEGKAALLAYLGELQRGPDIRPLSARLAIDEASASLFEGVSKLARSDQARPRPAPVQVRLQDGADEIEPLGGPARKKSILGRFFGRLFP